MVVSRSDGWVNIHMFHESQCIMTQHKQAQHMICLWRWRNLVIGTGLLAAAHAATAQLSDEDELAQVYGDKSFVSIATGSRQAVSRAPAVATVITAQDIAAMGATDLDQVLETVPGLHVARETQIFAPVYVIRGINLGFNPQVLVLLNGVPLTTVYTGNRGGGWGGFPLEHVERIEVIRGPGSALYGADAFAGVINIIQKAAGGTPGTQVGARLGSFETADTWFSHVGTWGKVDVSSYLRMGMTNGARRTVEADAQTGWDQLFNTQASLAPGRINLEGHFVDAALDLSVDHWRWRTGYRFRNNLGVSTGVASALDPSGSVDSESFSTDLSYDDPRWRENWSLNVQASYVRYVELCRLTLFPAGAFGGAFADGFIGNPDKWDHHGRVSVSTVYSGFSDHRIKFGLGAEREAVYKIRETKNFFYDQNGVLTPIGTGSFGDVIDATNTAPFMKPQARDNHYLFVQDEWNFLKDWTLTAGLRHDNYSDFGGTTNPRVALVWEAAYNVTAKLMYGSAFRAPSMSELYVINNPVVKGNPGLLPEKIETFEAALSWQPQPSLRLGMNVFHYRLRDIIQLVNALYENTGRQTGQGMELEATWDVSRTLRLSGNFSHQHSVDEQTDSRAPNSPAHHLYVRGDWRFTPGWSVHPQVNWISERPRAFGDPRAPLKGYTTVDLTLRAEPTESKWHIGVSVRNLFDVDAREPSPYDASPTGQPFISLPFDFPLPGRSVMVQASYDF